MKYCHNILTKKNLLLVIVIFFISISNIYGQIISIPFFSPHNNTQDVSADRCDTRDVSLVNGPAASTISGEKSALEIRFGELKIQLLKFTIPGITSSVSEHVKVQVSDLNGRSVKTLNNEDVVAREQIRIPFVAEVLTDGISIYHVKTQSGLNLTGKLVLVK